MKGMRVIIISMVILAAVGAAPRPAAGAEPDAWRGQVINIDTYLEPGVWHGWALNPSEVCGGYLVEVNPQEAGREGDLVQTVVVQPEYDGYQWYDVLRVMIPEGQPSLWVKMRVYRVCALPVVMEFEDTLEGGEWIGWVVGPAALERAYLVEVTPLEPSQDGAYIARSLVQQEFFMGEWQDVLRVQLAEGFPDLRVQLRVYALEQARMSYSFTTTLQPGQATRFGLGPSSSNAVYVAEINPLQTPTAGEIVEQVSVQPFYKGGWEDTLLLKASEDQPPIQVEVRVYVLGSKRLVGVIEE